MEETLTRILQTEIHRKIRCLMDHIIVLQSKIKIFSLENYGCIYVSKVKKFPKNGETFEPRIGYIMRYKIKIETT